LEERIIVIKKTLDPNHSKLYLFKTKDISAPKLFISGSSNLTTRGLVTQKEFNIEIKDYRFEEAEKYFDDLWKDSISLSEDDIRNLIDKIKNETSFKEKKSLYNKEANKYRNIAIEYSIKREHQEAIRYLQKSIELYEKNGDYYNVSKAKLDLGNIYTKIRELENAEKCLSEGLEGIKKKSDEYWEATGYWYFGWLCIYKKDKETARGYFARAYNLFKSIGAEKKAKDVLDDMEKLDKDLNRYSESSSLQTNKNNMENLDKDLNRYSESSSLNKNEKANTCDHIVTYKKSIIEKLLDAFKNLLKNVFKN
jgi:tetratricopeptide (TPR) repeat protein